MNSATRPAAEPSVLDPAHALRDDIAAHFEPASAYERLLVDNYAAAMARYQQALKVEQRAFSAIDPLEILLQSPDRFKALTRYVADCERACRRALDDLRRAIRQRPKEETPAQARKATRPQAPPPAVMTACASAPAAPSAALPHRE